MRNLRDDNRKRNDAARTRWSSVSPETPTFKRDLQLLEKLIVRKLEESPVSSGNLAAILFDDHFILIERLTAYWQHKEVLRMIRGARLKLARVNPDSQQQPLPGFEDMGERVTISGRKRRFAALTYALAVAHLKELEADAKANAGRIGRMRELLSLMEPYTRTEPQITVREVCEREARQ